MLPGTDCRKCGHDTCLVFAGELVERNASIDACPDVTAEAKRIFAEITAVEREMLSATKSALLQLVMLPVRAISLLLFTFPLSVPVWFLILWLVLR